MQKQPEKRTYANNRKAIIIITKKTCMWIYIYENEALLGGVY